MNFKIDSFKIRKKILGKFWELLTFIKFEFLIYGQRRRHSERQLIATRPVHDAANPRTEDG